MQSKNKSFSGFNLFDDITKMASGAVGTAFDAKHEIEQFTKQNFEHFLSMYNLVTRQEYEVVKKMVVKSREEQQDLKDRILVLEKELMKANKKNEDLKNVAKSKTSTPAKKKAVKKNNVQNSVAKKKNDK